MTLTYALAVAGTRDLGLVALAVVLEAAGPFAVAALGVSPGGVLGRTGCTDFGSGGEKKQEKTSQDFCCDD